MKTLHAKLAATVAATLLLVAGTAVAPATPAQAGASVIYFVRHAETATETADPRDPPLSAEGEQRAVTLARVLAETGLLSVHSTDLNRTRSTAAPVAEAFGLEVETYDPFDEEAIVGLADRLKSTPGGHLIVGHSNTTPEFVEAFGGDPISPIAETEYDRLYVLTVGSSGDLVSTLLRYGAVSGDE